MLISILAYRFGRIRKTILDEIHREQNKDT